MKGLLEPVYEDVTIGEAEVRETYKVSKIGTVAGCMVTDGKVTANAGVRLIREGIVIYTGKLGSLKRFKDDAKEVKKDFECGITIENYNDLKIGDTMEFFVQQEVPVE
jgi:translation initiation factor IF-2